MVNGSACLFILYLNTHVLMIVFTIECEVVNSIQIHSPIPFKHVPL